MAFGKIYVYGKKGGHTSMGVVDIQVTDSSWINLNKRALKEVMNWVVLLKNEEKK